MQIYEYDKMFRFEEDFWWYRGLRSLIKGYFGLVDPQRKYKKILDAGCGTGGNLELIKSLGYINIHGCDISPKAVAFCQKRGFSDTIEADINHLPYPDKSFDLIVCADVFECQEVDANKAIEELHRILKPEGHLIWVAAAFPFLLSEHDRSVHSVRRYTKYSAKRLFSNVGFKVNRLSYHYFFLFPFLALIKLIDKPKSGKDPQSHLKRTPKWLNEILTNIVKLEAKMIPYMGFPIGTSLIAVLKKA